MRVSTAEHQTVGVNAFYSTTRRARRRGQRPARGKQLAKRELSLDEQVWRFMWNRNVRFAPLLVETLDLDRVPRPLDRALAHVCAGAQARSSAVLLGS